MTALYGYLCLLFQRIVLLSFLSPNSLLASAAISLREEAIDWKHLKRSDDNGGRTPYRQVF